jgi:hypothetical protein
VVVLVVSASGERRNVLALVGIQKGLKRTQNIFKF